MKIFLDSDGVLNIDNRRYSKTSVEWKQNGDVFDIVALAASKSDYDKSLINGEINFNNEVFKDENNTPYATLGDLYEAIKGFLKPPGGAVQIINGDGSTVDVQNPLPTDGDSVYVKDVDFNCSDFTDWVGDSELLFQSPQSASIVNSTVSPVKSIKICFNRTVKTLQVGLGENNGGSFSNVKISLLGSGGAQRSIYDDSSNNEKKTSLNREFVNEVVNSILIEFHTTDEVSLSNIIIYKARYNTTQIQGKTPSGKLATVNTNVLGNLLVSLDEQKDAFGRLKTAEPYTIFDNSLNSQISNDIFWSNKINGSASSTYQRPTSSNLLEVSNSGDYVVRQTKQRFKYQPGKSHEFFITGLLNTELGVRKRVGLVDYDNVGLSTISNNPQNGVFFENEGGVLSWCIVNNGTITESVSQENWNIDSVDGNGRSGFVFNPNTTNIFTCQLEWLGVGVVLVGFATGGGSVVYVHGFEHASVDGFTDVYMRTANLPVAYEITSLSGVGSMKTICSSVISGGGFNPRGLTNSIQNPSQVDISSGDTELLCGLKLKEDSFEFTVDPEFISILSLNSGNSLWTLSINPTYTNTVTWSDKEYAEVQEAYNNNNIVTDLGIVVASGSFSNNADNLNEKIQTSLRVGKDLDGNLDELWLSVTALGNESYYGTINFKELI